MNYEGLAALRQRFEAGEVSKLPGTAKRPALDYVGHAQVTDRLLTVDPEWTWEPMGVDEFGNPTIRRREGQSALWIRLTVCGVTRPGVGIAPTDKDELEKELISDAIRNAAMRFGVALDLWKKHDNQPAPQPKKQAVKRPAAPAEIPPVAPEIEALTSRVRDLTNEQRSVFAAWKANQRFEWPWLPEDVALMDAKLDEMVGM